MSTPAADIRDIRPLISIPSWMPWILGFALALALLGVIGFGVRYFLRKSRRPLTSEEQARAALVRAEALAKAGRCREWAELVAQTLRQALAARLGRDACPETTSELAATDWTLVPDAKTVDGQGLALLLSSCDLSRFALGRLEPSGLLAATDAARAWVKRLFAAQELPAATLAEATS
jgi:Domain of unknown function (DUF4381)